MKSHIIIAIFVAMMAACGSPDDIKQTRSTGASEASTAPTTGRFDVVLMPQALWAQGARLTFDLNYNEVASRAVTVETYADIVTDVPFRLRPSEVHLNSATVEVNGRTYDLSAPAELQLKAGDDFDIILAVVNGSLIFTTSLILQTQDPDGDCIIGAADTDPFNPLVPPKPNPQTPCL